MTNGRKLSEIQTFDNVVVVPFADAAGKAQDAGPIWPNWERQTTVRHCRYGEPFDSLPVANDDHTEDIHDSMIWIGPAHVHFGHFVAEHATRILQSVVQMPTKNLLFGYGAMPMMRKGGLANTPQHFRSITAWLGAPPEKIEFCAKQIRVAALSVAPQAEQMTRVLQKNATMFVPDEYLDMLDANTERNKLVPLRHTAVFVSRSLLPAGLGSYGGSAYLDYVLEKCGVYIFHPERHSLTEQLAVYAGAEHLVLAEGSSIHGLQLLGRAFTSITVLNRIDGASMAKNYLTPRCHTLRYVSAIKNVYCFTDSAGAPRKAAGFSVLDEDVLLDQFREAGIDLTASWNSKKFNDAVETDLKNWVEARIGFVKDPVFRCHQNELVDALRTGGFAEISKMVEERVALYLSNH